MAAKLRLFKRPPDWRLFKGPPNGAFSRAAKRRLFKGPPNGAFSRQMERHRAALDLLEGELDEARGTHRG